MTTPKPGRGPDTDAGRIDLLARLQLVKGEVDAVLADSASASIGVLWVEVHGARPAITGAFVLRGAPPNSHSATQNLPPADRRLGAASELFSISFLLLGYGDFAERGWLRGVLSGGVIWKGGDFGVEAVHVCEVDALELQEFLRKAILAVCRSVLAPTIRRDFKNEQAVKDLLRTMADVLKQRPSAKALSGQLAKPLYEDRKLSRRQFGIHASRKGVTAGDPPRVIQESVVRAALASAVKSGLLEASGASSDRRYKITQKGWALAHATVEVERLAAMMAQAPIQFRIAPTQISFYCAALGEAVVFARADPFAWRNLKNLAEK
jgi:hypothetical protein